MLIKAQAEALGFRATLEQTVPTKDGSVDVGLQRGPISIACEISVTTGTTHEVGNILKCLRADFVHVAFISSDPTRVRQVSEAVQEQVAGEEIARIGFYSPEEFFAYLKRIAEENSEEPSSSPESEKPKVTKSRGWTIKRAVAQVTPKEAKEIEERAMQAIAETLRKKKSEA